jgi:hypothetical protein
MSDREILDVIAHLQCLQLRQTELLIVLGELSQNRDNNDAAAAARAPPNVVREFTIGNRVRIKNPRLFQANRGTIVKISASRITVRTGSGSKILRALHNIEIENE